MASASKSTDDDFPVATSRPNGDGGKGEIHERYRLSSTQIIGKSLKFMKLMRELSHQEHLDIEFLMRNLGLIDQRYDIFSNSFVYNNAIQRAEVRVEIESALESFWRSCIRRYCISTWERQCKLIDFLHDLDL